MADKAHLSLPDSVEINGIVIYKLDLFETVDAMKYLRDFPKIFAAVQGIDTSETGNLLQVLTPLVIDFLPEALQILSIATRTPPEELKDKIDIGQAIECFIGIFKVNDFLSLGTKIMGLMSMINAPEDKPQTKK